MEAPSSWQLPGTFTCPTWLGASGAPTSAGCGSRSFSTATWGPPAAPPLLRPPSTASLPWCMPRVLSRALPRVQGPLASPPVPTTLTVLTFGACCPPLPGNLLATSTAPSLAFPPSYCCYCCCLPTSAARDGASEASGSDADSAQPSPLCGLSPPCYARYSCCYACCYRSYICCDAACYVWYGSCCAPLLSLSSSSPSRRSPDCFASSCAFHCRSRASATNRTRPDISGASATFAAVPEG